MSFRRRLTLFFVAIVVVPMAAIAVLVSRISEDSTQGKADARLATGLETAVALYEDALAEAPRELRRIGGREEVGTALVEGDREQLGVVAQREVRRDGTRLVAVRFYDDEGAVLAAAGPASALARERAAVALPAGAVGEIEVAMLGPRRYAAEVSRLTGFPAAVVGPEGVLAATPELREVSPPTAPGPATVSTTNGDRRAASLDLIGAPPGARLLLTVEQEPGFTASQPLVLAVLGIFLALATVLIFVVLSSLQGQVASMLGAARRIGNGDFSQKVPVEGNDEMAGLAREFNKMSDQLSAHIADLVRQRKELDQSMKRIGEAFAAGLDLSALLEIVAETAIAACQAESGRIELISAGSDPITTGAAPGRETAAALSQAAAAAVERGEVAEATVEGRIAIAHPLQRPGDSAAAIGSLAVARRSRPFTTDDRATLRYLAGQASVSVENVGLHERVAEQAVTDELTGLANVRAFREWMQNETERVGRFGSELSLVLLDIDNFKHLNDTYGHLQGDEVLRSVGRILRLESRGVDQPARYGGEEFIVALPETPKEGAIEVAERIRGRIERTVVPGVEGNREVGVTASIGVATMPHDGAAGQVLIGAADEALYEAKRSGKNRVIAANGPGAAAQGNRS